MAKQSMTYACASALKPILAAALSSAAIAVFAVAATAATAAIANAANPAAASPSVPAPAPAASSALSVPPSPAFLQYWKSGLAELTSYSITVERYGEMRRAQGVMVFVYEEINADTRIKVESDRTPAPKRVPVLKLNNILKFNTGVYDYSVMTSVFAGLTGPGSLRPFPPQKISFTSQEWCGQVFHQIVPRSNGLYSEIHSYFEAEGDAIGILPYPKDRKGIPAAIYYEDEMPILVRELDGTVLPEMIPRRFNMVPGLWERRKRHSPLAFAEAVLTKAGPEKIRIAGKEMEALKWTLEMSGLITTYHVEAAQPRRLLAWENGKGEKGEMIASIRNTYWKHNHDIDLPLRKQLGLTYGVGE